MMQVLLILFPWCGYIDYKQKIQMKTSKAEDAEADTGAAPPESLPEVTKGKHGGGLRFRV